MACLQPVGAPCRIPLPDAHMRTGYSGIMDFILALLPWKVIWKLQMKRKEKFGVALAMSMGIL
jgi:hypothetical protein